jgi:processive 1,2-diacylglycerol beta-glucosyltransferase
MTAAPHVLILSASVGAGHLRAAQAVELALRELHPEAHVRNLDVLEMTNSLFRRLYAKAYVDLINRAPHVLGYFYDLLDRPSKSGRHRRDRLRLALEKLNLRAFIRFLKEEPCDLVINTHFLPAEIIASLRRKRQLAVPQVTVTTDFETHRLWVNTPCDHYFTATEEGARYLHHWSVPAADVSVTGIPIHPVFRQHKDRSFCRSRHGLAEDRPVVLQLAGGFGVGPVAAWLKALLEVERPLQLIAIAGRNEAVRKQLQNVKAPERHRVKVLGFTDQIDELMASADLVVSKPGGLTTSEVLARGAVMVIVNPIPGQESRNSDYLLEQGAAIKVNNPAMLAYKVASLLDDPKRLYNLRTNSIRLGRPRAALDVVARSLRLLTEPRPMATPARATSR